MGVYIIILLVSLIVICFAIPVRFGLLSPFIAGIVMPIYSLLYAYVYQLFISLPENPYVYSDNVLFIFSIFLIIMIFSPNHTRTTKSGKADKRFKEKYDSDKVSISFWCFIAGLCSLAVSYGINTLLENFGIVLTS